MTAAVHPAAPHALPNFITAPGETDHLLIIAGVILVGAVLGVGLLFLRLHTLPERMAHKAHKLQFEIVAVLGLLALFTHIHLFWVAGLLLALIDLPDISGTFGRMARAGEDRGQDRWRERGSGRAGSGGGCRRAGQGTAGKPSDRCRKGRQA